MTVSCTNIDTEIAARRATAAIAAFLISFGSPTIAQARAIGDLLQGIQWGETQRELLMHFGPRATVLQRPIDFGDSYTQIVLRDVVLGGVPLIAFLQIDKATGGLKRIQIERQRHGVNPPVFRAVVGALEAEYGAPEGMCGIPPNAGNGYQTAVELAWWGGVNFVRAVLRDTTIEAFEGCPSREITTGPCGLTGQLLIRISPLGTDATNCPHAGP